MVPIFKSALNVILTGSLQESGRDVFWVTLARIHVPAREPAAVVLLAVALSALALCGRKVGARDVSGPPAEAPSPAGG